MYQASKPCVSLECDSHFILFFYAPSHWPIIFGMDLILLEIDI